MDNGHSTHRSAGRRQLLPFAALAVAVLALAAIAPVQGGMPALVVAGGLTAVVLTTSVLVPWARAPSWTRVLPALVYCAAVAALREATGGASSAFAPVLLVPLTWTALHGTRRQLYVVLGVSGLALLLPVLLVGAPDYPVSELRRVVVWILIAPVVGIAVHDLVERLRASEGMLAVVARVVRSLPNDAGAARQSLCAAACAVSGARIAFLAEPDGKGSLASTAAVGMPRFSVAIGTESSGTVVAFTSGEPFFVARAEGNPAVSQRLVTSTGARSVLYEPVLRAGRPVGVLGVAWVRPLRRLDQGAARVVALLADEAATIIERADLLRQANQEARVDELTGLPNRRHWNDQLPRELARARRDGTPLTVAMLDLDHFKRFNDAHGHHAGDRLLAEAAAAWRGQLRDVDTLVRWGGEEFAVILPACRVEDAREVVERIRSMTPAGQTCSAGIAGWGGAEPADALMRCADEALYHAKAAGRDRVQVSGHWLSAHVRVSRTSPA